jgi:redox-sensing transcriptional repressor
MTLKDDPTGPQPNDKKMPRTLRTRLPHYYRLAERLLRAGRQEIAVDEMAAELDIPAAQITQDIIGLGLQVGDGAKIMIEPVKDVAEHLLGLRPINVAVLVGMGRLGSAIASYEGFGPYGMRIVAVFDADPDKIGRFVGGLRILPLEQLEDVIGIFQIRLAVLTVPPEDAQEIALRLVRAGVQAIWNFAPVRLEVPDEIVVRNEHIAAGLAHLCNDLREANLRRLPPEM